MIFSAFTLIAVFLETPSMADCIIRLLSLSSQHLIGRPFEHPVHVKPWRIYITPPLLWGMRWEDRPMQSGGLHVTCHRVVLAFLCLSAVLSLSLSHLTRMFFCVCVLSLCQTCVPLFLCAVMWSCVCSSLGIHFFLISIRDIGLIYIYIERASQKKEPAEKLWFL